MRRLLILCALIAALAAPTFASNRACNGTLVTQNVCRNSTNLVLFYDAPAAAFADLRDAILKRENYQAEVVCAATRQYDQLLNGQPARTLAAAGADVDSCAVGAVVANPQTSGDFADAVVDRTLRNWVIQWKHETALEQADDIGNVPTPDVGDPDP